MHLLQLYAVRYNYSTHGSKALLAIGIASGRIEYALSQAVHHRTLKVDHDDIEYGISG